MWSVRQIWAIPSCCKNETREDFAFLFHSVKNIIVEIHGTTYSPQYLIADASLAITKGFEAVFIEGFIRQTYVLHTYNHEHGQEDVKNCRQEKVCRIRQDKPAVSDSCFQHAIVLLKKKWTNCNGQNDEFLIYMQENCAEQDCLKFI